MTVDELNLALLVGAAVLVVAVVAVRFSVGTGLPSLLLYLGLGVLLGEGGAGVRFDDYELTTVLGYAALIVILAEGGLTTRWSTIKDSVAPAALLATLGTSVSVAVVAVATHWVLGTDWVTSVLLGAIVSSTDAAAVFSVLRRVPLPRRLTGILEAESGFNDAPVVILVVALSEAVESGELHSPAFLVVEAVAELGGGAVVGLVVGWLGARLLHSVALPSSGLYPIAVLALAGLAYGTATAVHASGFLAVYLSALVLGNSDLPHRQTVRGFAEGMGWLAQIGLFVLLGLLVSPSQLLPQVVPALIIGAVLLLLARPLSVVSSVPWFRFGWRDQVFLSWAGLRGAVPVVLATIPVAGHVAGTSGLVELVFVLVVVFTLVQAPTLPFVARTLRLRADEPVDLELESSPLGRIGADVMQVSVGPTSRLHGVRIGELRLPVGAGVTLVVRGGAATVPDLGTVLRHGDDLLVVSTAEVREEAEARLRAISRDGRLAQWRGTDDAPPRRRRGIPRPPSALR